MEETNLSNHPYFQPSIFPIEQLFACAIRCDALFLSKSRNSA